MWTQILSSLIKHTMKVVPKTLNIIPTLTIIFLSVYNSFALNPDGLILASFKISILSDPLRVLDSWSLLDDTPCSWRGVTCGSGSDSGRVISVSLSRSQLLGTIPANFGRLDRLQTLILSSNLINGTLPDTLFSVSTLRLLDLAGNLISGEISGSVGGLRSLTVLNLADNALSGNIPANLGSLPNLRAVTLRCNYFTGNLPGGFDRVRILDLSSNLINGSLPVDFGGRSIRFLNLSYNGFRGDISAEFGRNIPQNATLDLSYNNFTGEIPNFGVFRNKRKKTFDGNPDLCGPPLSKPCTVPPVSGQPVPSPAFAAFPRNFSSSPDSGPQGTNQENGQSGGDHRRLKPQTIVCIVVGDVGGIAILSLILFYIYKSKTNNTITSTTTKTTRVNSSKRHEVLLSSSSSSSSNTKGITKWTCFQNGKNYNMDESEEEITSSIEEKGQLVTVDGESEIELETLLRASAYMLGTSSSSIMYKAVLEDGTVLAVRRVGEGATMERLKEFDGYIRSLAKMVHPNLVRVRGYYWALDDKLVIYEYVPAGTLANARYRKGGSSPCHIPWEVRLRIAYGIARGLTYIHDKKHVHGNLKSNNILLDCNLDPKIADFGIDKLTTSKSGYVSAGGSTRYFGSMRSTGSRDSFRDNSAGATPSPSPSSIGCVSLYHPPESLRSLKPNAKWDVYSFGVLLLELITGKVIISDELGPPVLAGLLDDKTRVLRMADPAIRVEVEGKEEDLLTCLKLGYNCVSHAPQKRPSMKEVVHVLQKVYASSIASSSSSYRYGL
ncbi:putative LRR receptor-like serine/threonine-protein kinase At4g37250 [Silene latifolia]|uniref:putative LRR receptor-like serine/threonine-protein kinase At4g37250 n=1 Tax=Silene latifolia TaxID=37657 RepID=UPI003D76F5E9